MTQQTSSLLADSLTIKPSQLYVRELQKVTSYYRDMVGLDLLASTTSHAILGQDDIPVLEIVSKPEYPNSSIRNAGLFHNAIVYKSRATLAEAVHNILRKAPWSYEGSADHLVSKAFYFHDPEDNGLELYFDRPREDWRWNNGSVMMDTLYLDPAEFIVKNIANQRNPIKELGHVHLRVGDIPSARKFYIDQLGFDATADMGSALFVSVGGYHHHLAMNTWHSAGASKRDPSLGLGEVKIMLPNDGSIDRLTNRLSGHGVKFDIRQDQLLVNDPWNNQLAIGVE